MADRSVIILLLAAALLTGFLLGNHVAVVSLDSQRESAGGGVRDTRSHGTSSSQAAPSFPIAALDEPDSSGIPDPSDTALLINRHLLFPVLGFDPNKITDTFDDSRGSRTHEAQDIMASRGSIVVAIDDGMVKKLFKSQAGGLTIYQFDPSEQFSYYYAHLDSYADGLQEGLVIRKGVPLGYVGSTGNAKTPHLHFAIFKLGTEKAWWKGHPVNPYPILKRSPAE